MRAHAGRQGRRPWMAKWTQVSSTCAHMLVVRPASRDGHMGAGGQHMAPYSGPSWKATCLAHAPLAARQGGRPGPPHGRGQLAQGRTCQLQSAARRDAVRMDAVPSPSTRPLATITISRLCLRASAARHAWRAMAENFGISEGSGLDFLLPTFLSNPSR